MTELESVAAAGWQHVDEPSQPVAICLEIPRKLEEDRTRFRAEQPHARFHKGNRIRAGFFQAFPVSDELRRLPGENEITRRLPAPVPHSFLRRRAIERSIDLGTRKLRCVPGKPVVLRDIGWVEPPAPAVISPARRTNPGFRKACHVVRPTVLPQNGRRPRMFRLRP